MADRRMGRDTGRLRTQIDCPRLYVFNPGHEEALLHAKASSYTPSKEVQEMQRDLWAIMCLEASEDDYIYAPDQRLYRPDGALVVSASLPESLALVPWAYDPHSLRRVERACSDWGVELLRQEITPRYLELSHRRTSAHLMQYLIEHMGYPDYLLPRWIDYQKDSSAVREQICRVAEEIGESYPEMRRLFLKRPFSSSGRGVMPIPYPLDERHINLLISSCKSRGSLSLEPELNVLENWAVEYYVYSQQMRVDFVAFSLFMTGAGGKSYIGNRLCSQEKLRRQLEETIGQEHLETLLSALHRYIRTHILGAYTGYLGIDMFVYEHNGERLLNPAVEINLRTTMGVMAHLAFERYCSPEAEGVFVVGYSPEEEDKKIEEPLVYDSSDKLVRGYLPLLPPSTEPRKFVAYLRLG